MNLRELGSSLGNTLYRGVGRASGQVQEIRSLPVDVLEDDDSYLLVFDAPGVEKEDVQVRYLDGAVKIRIDRFREFHDGFEMRFPGRGMALDGEAPLPEDAIVEPDAGTAWITDHGTLHVEIPKADHDREPEADAIEIED